MRFSFTVSILGLALSSILGAQKVWANNLLKNDQFKQKPYFHITILCQA